MTRSRTPRNVASRLAAALLAFLTVSTLRAQSLPRAKPEDAGLSSDRLELVHALVQRYIDAGEFTGSVTLIARKGKIVYLETQGTTDLDSKTPMRPDAIFRLASMTKPITSAAVMSLVEQGKLLLTDPVSKFIPEFKNQKVVARISSDALIQGDRAPQTFAAVPADHDITIYDLITHTSGFASNGPSRDAMNKLLDARTSADTLATIIPKAAAALPLDFQPGAKWQYSNFLGFETLARVVEIVSGQTYDQFLRRHFFDPLGMKDAFFAVKLPKDRMQREPTLYRKVNGKLQNSADAEDPAIARPEYLSGSGGLAMTADDYARFAQAMLNGGELGGKRILSPRTVQVISTDHVGKLYTVPGFGFGLGVEVLTDATKALTLSSNGSYGWGGALGTYFWIDPAQQLFCVTMVQTWNTPAIAQFHQALRNVVSQAIVN